MILVATFCLVLATYLLLVKTLRYQRLRDAQTRFHRLKAENLLDPSAAQEIAHTALLYDMPFFSRLGAQIALFKTYGIPTIAALLLKTGELTDDNFMSKRVTDMESLSFICALMETENVGKAPE
ncbi:hypothetical protein MPER_08915 [Moniliophthora perniciosa FA553]|nr:hypothetical protein MPER_08915 [Moniliophthora perniciosa FA553]